jgi:CheY-like chemotaxis protein
MSSNVFQLPTGPRRRVMIAHHRSEVRHALRTLIEAEDVAIIEVPDGEIALMELERVRFDLLILELDLPVQDGVTVMQLHRILLAQGQLRVEPPAIIFTLAPEVRGNTTLTDHLTMIGAAGFIDDEPRSEVAGLVAATLRSRATQLAVGKPAAA